MESGTGNDSRSRVDRLVQIGVNRFETRAVSFVFVGSALT